ncbi:hypothetical protein [Embleya sp. NPDC050493]|uniref:hypothetical protein n=1 Tax=Embleya sp. NPDC050493 TaxID=3363989 RepID=UPI00378C7E7A
MTTNSGAVIVVRRVREGMRDILRAHRVLVDGQVVGKVKRGQVLTVAVAPGPHRVRLAIDWCSSPELEVTVPDGGTAAFVCAPGGSPLDRGAAGPQRRGRYIVLEADTNTDTGARA